MANLTIEQLLRRGLSHRAQRLSLEELRTLPVASWDIESTGLKADIDQVLCATIQPLGGKPKTFRIDTRPKYRDRRWDDSTLCTAIRDELEKYLVVIHHFGDLFDLPFVNTRLIGWNRRPIDTTKMVFLDTWRLSRSKLCMRNNRLVTLIEYLDTKTKKSSVHGRMWSRAMVGDKVGLDYVVRHNIADVNALEEVILLLGKYLTMPYRMYK